MRFTGLVFQSKEVLQLHKGWEGGGDICPTNFVQNKLKNIPLEKWKDVAIYCMWHAILRQ